MRKCEKSTLKKGVCCQSSAGWKLSEEFHSLQHLFFHDIFQPGNQAEKGNRNLGSRQFTLGTICDLKEKEGQWL